MINKKIILDTNLWISFLLSKKLNQIDRLIEENRVTFVFSDELLEEFISVISRPKFKKYFHTKDIAKILTYFDQYGELVKVETDLFICRDKKDNFLLNLSIDSNANYLVTGDKDLLILEKIGNTTILTYGDFIGKMEE